MFGTPLTQDSIKAETAYRLERARREFWSPRRRARAEQADRTRPRRARRAFRAITAA
jgi:hypothetical protein